MPAPPAYFDSSVLVKHYVREEGSARARALFRRHRVFSSAIAPVELLSALTRRRAAGELTEPDLAAIVARMRTDRGYWELVEVSERLLGRAEEFVQRTGVRTLDAIHLASVATIRGAGLELPFVTGDGRQRDAADRLEFDVVWVG